MNVQSRNEISSGKDIARFHSSLLTTAIALFAFLLALLLNIKFWIAVVGGTLLLLIVVGIQHLSTRTNLENHTRTVTNLILVLTTMGLVLAAPDSLKRHSAPETNDAESPLKTALPVLLNTPVNNLRIVDEESAQLTVCTIESPDVKDTENVKYRASVHWLRSPMSEIVTFHIGAINPNDELWPQMTSARIVQGQDAQVDFVVSRESMFPTRFVLIGLDRLAEETRENTCGPGRSCYLQLPRAGVFRVSDEFIVNSFEESVPHC